MKIRVFTLCYGNAWERYGQVFAESFARFWPKDVELVVVSDRALPLPRGTCRDLLNIPGVADFRRRWRGSDKASGLTPPPGTKVDDRGYSWRHDALKWMPQAMAPLAVTSDMYDGDILAWFDADVETIAPVTPGWISTLLDGGDVACLQRRGTHTEIGFYGIRVSDASRHFLARFADYYTSDQVFGLKEWHSAYVFDRALAVSRLRVTNLNIGGGKGHVWPASPLSGRTVHRKGKRKDRR